LNNPALAPELIEVKVQILAQFMMFIQKTISQSQIDLEIVVKEQGVLLLAEVQKVL
jgi:hypothetical protein